jgi:hypothetical protein
MSGITPDPVCITCACEDGQACNLTFDYHVNDTAADHIFEVYIEYTNEDGEPERVDIGELNALDNECCGGFSGCDVHRTLDIPLSPEYFDKTPDGDICNCRIKIIWEIVTQGACGCNATISIIAPDGETIGSSQNCSGGSIEVDVLGHMNPAP